MTGSNLDVFLYVDRKHAKEIGICGKVNLIEQIFVAFEKLF